MNLCKAQGFGAAMLGGLLATAVLGSAATSARADASGDMLDLSAFERVIDDSLGGLRGGFRVGNVDLSFGVTMSTSVNGQQVLQTVFSPGDSPVSNTATTPDQLTTVSHEIGRSITTDIANSADNRLIQNTTTVDVFLNNISQVQAQATMSHMTTNMITDLNNHFTMGN